MSEKPKVLIVEDRGDYQEKYRMRLGEKVLLLQAKDLQTGERLFLENPDIVLVVMDACVPGVEPNSVPLIRKVRKTFNGPMIAASMDPSYRRLLVEQGCSHQSPKDDVSFLVCQILGLP